MTHPPAHPVWVWPANLLVPGAGHVMVGRVLAGALYALVWGGALGGLLLIVIFRADRAASYWPVFFAAAAIVFYAAPQVDLMVRLRADKRFSGGEERDQWFKSALAAHLQGRLEEAESICKDLLKADPDDVEATLQLASVARCRGDAAAARAYLARARYLDDEGRWDFEIERELASLGRPAASPAK